MRSLGAVLSERRLTLARARPDDGDRFAPPSPPDSGPPPPACWEERWPRNVCGVASALTTFSSMRRVGALRLRAFFWVRYHVPWIRRRDAKPLVKLSFIHFAQWAMIDRLPGNEGMKDERLRPRYLLFLTNFNGGFDQYIDAFSYVISLRIKLIWRGGHGFPGPQPAATFKEYIHRQEFPAALFYSAYPEATATRVTTALEAAERFDAFVAAAPEGRPFEFAEAWTELLTQIEPSL